MLYYPISRVKFDKISTCETAKEMWNKVLEVTYERTNKEARISSLVNEYELFKMAEDENVENVFSRFSKIIHELKFLGMIYSNGLHVRNSLEVSQKLA